MSKSVVVDFLPTCDFDASHGPAYADFKTSFGPWGYGCKDCFTKYGGRLGTGYGQVLKVSAPVTVGAVVVDRTYSAGTPYSTVVCDDCLVALNSGHHYPADARHHAVALADKHNAEVHDA